MIFTSTYWGKWGTGSAYYQYLPIIPLHNFFFWGEPCIHVRVVSNFEVMSKLRSAYMYLHVRVVSNFEVMSKLRSAYMYV